MSFPHFILQSCISHKPGRVVRNSLAVCALLLTIAVTAHTASAAVIVVTTAAGTGAGSLPQAILDSNSSVGVLDTITFAIPGPGVHTISPTSTLLITDPVIIDGYTQPGASANTQVTGSDAVLLVEINGGAQGTDILTIISDNNVFRGLVINRGPFDAVHINSPNGGNFIEGNFIGTDATGTIDLGNGRHGVSLFFSPSPNNVIGGVTPAARNVISGNNGTGIAINGALSTGNTIRGNYIGTNAAGTAALPNNDFGVFIGSASGNTVGGTVSGAGNVISNNGADGVAIIGSGTGNAVQGNAITANGGLGIDLADDGVTGNETGDGDTGPNNLQNFPVLTSVSSSGGNTVIVGTLNSLPATSYRIEFFANDAIDPSGNGEGQSFIGFTTVTTDATGNASINVNAPAMSSARRVTATATDPTGNTSEFSAGSPPDPMIFQDGFE